MIKKYQVKYYEKDWTLKWVVNPKDIINSITFVNTKDWWQWDVSLQLNLDFEDSSFKNSDFVRIYEYDDDNKTWRLIYTWYISQIKRIATVNQEIIELTLLWLATLLNEVLFYQSWNYTFTKNQDPAQTIKDIIDYFNTKYTWNWLTYSWWYIINYWTSISIDFDYTDCYEAIKLSVEPTNYYRHIDQNWEVYFKAKSTTADHRLTFQKDIEQLTITEDSEKVINNIELKRKSWTNTYSDEPSEIDYWFKQKYISNTNLADSWSADEYGNNYLNQYWFFINKTDVTLNSKFDFETIKPWETIKILNFNYFTNNTREVYIKDVDWNYIKDVDWNYIKTIWDNSLQNLQIVRTTYSPDKIVLQIEDYTSFWEEVTL